MKIFKIWIALLIVFCNTACSTSGKTQTSSDRCPKQPQGVLETSNVKSISLDSQTIKASGMVSTEQSLGYTFEARSGQKIDYKTDDKICIWVYTPDNQIVSSTDLPQTGKYIIQVSALKGSTTFDLEIGLDIETQTSQSPEVKTPDAKKGSSSAVSSASQIQFSKADYPKAVCGDPKPTDRNAYPLKFYPVNVPYNEKNLAKARAYFCRDAYKKTSVDNGEIFVQVVSFTDPEKAKAFASMVNSEIAGANVGSPTTVYN